MARHSIVFIIDAEIGMQRTTAVIPLPAGLGEVVVLRQMLLILGQRRGILHGDTVSLVLQGITLCLFFQIVFEDRALLRRDEQDLVFNFFSSSFNHG